MRLYAAQSVRRRVEGEAEGRSNELSCLAVKGTCKTDGDENLHGDYLGGPTVEAPAAIVGAGWGDGRSTVMRSVVGSAGAGCGDYSDHSDHRGGKLRRRWRRLTR